VNYASARRSRRYSYLLLRAAQTNSLCAILPTSWIAGLMTFSLAPPAANEAIATSEIATARIVLGFRIIRVPIEIALNPQI
jgi:hypothetical protein